MGFKKTGILLFLFHASIDIVVVDGFQVFGFHAEPVDIEVGLKA
jgi:hypothetical protein